MCEVTLEVMYKVFCVIFACFWASNEAKTASRNDLIPGQDIHSAITTNGEQIVQKLDQIVEALQLSNQKTSETANVQIFTILREQESRLQALESQIQDCRNKNEDYQRLVQQVQGMELRLNNTIQENIDLRVTIDMLQENDSFTDEQVPNNENDLTASNSRKPRNFLASSSSSANSIWGKPGVAFDAYRNKPFHETQATITYDGTLVNHGHGLNISNGIFTAPIAGTYAFHFHALTRDGTATYIKFMHNGRNVGGAYRRHEGEADENHEESPGGEIGLQRAEGMLAQSVVLSLEENDEVGVFAYHGNLRDGGWHYTHFTGYLLF